MCQFFKLFIMILVCIYIQHAYRWPEIKAGGNQLCRVDVRTMNRCEFEKLCNVFDVCKADEPFTQLKECDRDMSAHLQYRKAIFSEKLNGNWSWRVQVQ